MGPCIYGAPDSGERLITNNAPVVGDLDMKNHRITNVKEPRGDEPADVATVEFVDRLVNNRSGPLDLGTHRITNLGVPEEGGDAVNKQYVHRIIQQSRPYDLGRYLVFPNLDDTKSYFSVDSKRNINLDDDTVFRLFNGNEESLGVIHLAIEMTLVPIQGKTDVITRLDRPLTLGTNVSQPWTFLFSAKPYNPPTGENNISLYFHDRAPGVSDSIIVSWSPNTFTYLISGQNPVSVEIDADVINHFAFEYSERKLIFWINCISRKTHAGIDLGQYRYITIGKGYFGIVDLYRRELSKPEIIEHFIKYHVGPFTNDEVHS